MKTLARWTVFATAMFAFGCVSLLPETAPPKPRYHIQPANIDALEGAPVSWSLVIEDPRATRVYDSARIAVSTAPGKVEYFAGAEWADRAPRLLQTALVQTFEDSGRILVVGDRSSVPVGDIVLQTDIRKLELDARTRDGAAAVSLYVRLTDGKGGVYAARKFDASKPARSVAADDVVDAFDEAFALVISDIVVWVFERGEKIVGPQS